MCDGWPSMAHKSRTHGPAAITSCSQRPDVVGVAAPLLVQDRGGAGRPPVAEHRQHVRAAVALPLDEHRGVADRLLLGVDLRDVLVHRLRGDLQVADGVVGERLRVRLPDADRVRHELAHGRLEVVVADDAAGDAGRAGAHAPLVDDEDVLAAAQATAAELACEMPGGGEPVDTRANDHVPAVTRNHRVPPFAAASPCTIASEAIAFPFLLGIIPWPERVSQLLARSPPCSGPLRSWASSPTPGGSSAPTRSPGAPAST